MPALWCVAFGDNGRAWASAEQLSLHLSQGGSQAESTFSVEHSLLGCPESHLSLFFIFIFFLHFTNCVRQECRSFAVREGLFLHISSFCCRFPLLTRSHGMSSTVETLQETVGNSLESSASEGRFILFLFVRHHSTAAFKKTVFLRISHTVVAGGKAAY